MINEKPISSNVLGEINTWQKIPQKPQRERVGVECDRLLVAKNTNNKERCGVLLHYFIFFF